MIQDFRSCSFLLHEKAINNELHFKWDYTFWIGSSYSLFIDQRVLLQKQKIGYSLVHFWIDQAISSILGVISQGRMSFLDLSVDNDDDDEEELQTFGGRSSICLDITVSSSSSSSSTLPLDQTTDISPASNSLSSSLPLPLPVPVPVPVPPIRTNTTAVAAVPNSSLANDRFEFLMLGWTIASQNWWWCSHIVMFF